MPLDWSLVGKGEPDGWLYFYEEFLEVYDNDLRKQTGSDHTPPEVVGAMVGLVDEVLRSSRFGLHNGLASPSVRSAIPATGTGTFMLGVLEDRGDRRGRRRGRLRVVPGRYFPVRKPAARTQ